MSIEFVNASTLPLGAEEVFRQKFPLMISRVHRKLCLESRLDSRVVVEFGNQNEAVGDKIMLFVPNDASPPFSRNVSIFCHEYTHLVLKREWGTCHPIFNEGVPVAIADFDRCRRVTGATYHSICKYLLHTGRLLPLFDFLQPKHFFELRGDARGDMVCGSFVRFLIVNFGVAPIRQLFLQYKRPTPRAPELPFLKFIRSVFSCDFEELEVAWLNRVNKSRDLNEAQISGIERAIVPRPLATQWVCDFCNMTNLNTVDVCSLCNANGSDRVRVV